MIAGYYAYKLYNTILSRYTSPLKQTMLKPGIRAGCIGNFRFAKRILFYFGDTQLVHLGDQLFHQPLIDLFRPVFDVTVAVSGVWTGYYQAQGISTILPTDYDKISGAVIITKDDLAYSCSRLFPNGNYFIGINYHMLDDQRPICLALTSTVRDLLCNVGVECPSLPEVESGKYAPFVPEVLPTIDIGAYLDLNKRYLVYNDYVSSNHTSALKRRPLLFDLAKQQWGIGFSLIYTGSEKERAERPERPEFIDVDLRGKISPLDLYFLFSQANIHGIITFDTLGMHVASALRKDLYVVIRAEKFAKLFRRKYVPMYPGADDIVKAYI